jgi:hypothetical protein
VAHGAEAPAADGVCAGAAQQLGDGGSRVLRHECSRSALRGGICLCLLVVIIATAGTRSRARGAAASSSPRLQPRELPLLPGMRRLRSLPHLLPSLHVNAGA